MIETPTRVTCLSESLIDLFITNSPVQDIDAGIIVAHLGDHLPIYMFSKRNNTLKARRNQCKSFIMQEINPRTMNDFRNQLRSVDWTPVFECNDADTAYDTLMRIMKNMYTSCFKLKKVKKSRKIRKPWLTNEWLKLIRKKNPIILSLCAVKKPG